MRASAFEHVCEEALRPALNAFSKGTVYRIARFGESFEYSQELTA